MMIDRDVQAQIGRVCGILIAVGLVLWIASQFRGCEPQTPEEKHRAKVASREFDAVLASQKAVRQYLKHPLDAEFPWTPPHAKTNAAGDRFVLRGTVKAPNDFGAMLTHQWSTIVVFASDPLTGEQPKVLMVAIDGEILYRSDRLDELKTCRPSEG